MNKLQRAEVKSLIETWTHYRHYKGDTYRHLDYQNGQTELEVEVKEVKDILQVIDMSDIVDCIEGMF